MRQAPPYARVGGALVILSTAQNAVTGLYVSGPELFPLDEGVVGAKQGLSPLDNRLHRIVETYGDLELHPADEIELCGTLPRLNERGVVGLLHHHLPDALGAPARVTECSFAHAYWVHLAWNLQWPLCAAV